MHKLRVVFLIGIVLLITGLGICQSTIERRKIVIPPDIDADLLPIPIWIPQSVLPGGILLFRRTFTTTTVTSATLDIFADTRYEVWLDGVWLGRGPARFSQVRQEYDSYVLDALDAGQHTIAFVVQYAPNNRRSEDLGGALFAQVSVPSTGDILAGTNADWRVLTSPAWDTRSGYISPWQLIAPREILDLRALPNNWMQPDYDDSAWLTAQALEPSPLTALTPRTIPMLTNITRLPVEVVEAGLLSPNCHFAALQSHYELTTSVTTTLRIESLVTPTLTLDGIPLTWHALNEERRPDVLTATAMLLPGEHILRVLSPTVENELLTLCATGVEWEALPTPVVYKPEQRMLLANPVPGGKTAPTVQFTPDGAEIDIPAGDTPRYVVLDFGRTLHARMIVTATGEAGTVIDAGWDERLTENRPLPSSGSLTPFAWGQVDTWVLDGTPRVLTTLDTRAGRYLLIQVFGSAAVRLSGLHALEETYPVEARGSFTSSDPLLNRIWQVGVDTLIPNMTDAYADPWRERGQWWGDAFVAFYINRVAYGDVALFRRGLRQMGEAIQQDGRPQAAPPHDGGMLLDYGLLWIEGLYDYWQYTDDLALVAEIYPAAQRFLDFCGNYENDRGLLNMPQAHWSQSALIDWSAATSRSGESVALNALYAHALRTMGEMAGALDDIVLADKYMQKSVIIQNRLNQGFFMPETGSYITSRYGGEIRPPRPHAQAYIVRYGIAPGARQERVVQAMVAQMTPFLNSQGWAAVEMYGMFWVLEALGQTWQTQPALTLIRKQYGRLLSQGMTTWPELITTNQDHSHSLSHAWGGSPTWYLSTYVLGAQVIDKTTWRIAPQPGDLHYAQGEVPTPMGTLVISWTRQTAEIFALDVKAPLRTRGSILLPDVTAETRVWFNQQLVWDAGPLVGKPKVTLEDRGLHIAPLSGGDYQIRVCFSENALQKVP